MATYPVLDRQTALDRLRRPSLNPFSVEEEEAHPWRVQHREVFREPLLRVWDSCSGSQPEDDGFMRSRAPEMRLDDRESRRSSLSIHFDYRNWTPTPYISFTTSANRVDDLVARRINQRPGQIITVIDPNIRVQNGLPILDAKAEMDHYEIEDPYGGYGQYYYDEYLCLWQVTAAEIVGHWAWNDLVNDEDWYHNIILPAFEQFIKTTAASGVTGEVEGINDLQSIFANLSVTRDLPSNTSPDVFEWGLDDYDDDDDDDDKRYWDTDGEGDTDDEVEEANRTDDIIKMIEGDYTWH